MTDTITITREPVFNGHGMRTPYSWLYTVTVPGERYPMRGKGVDWARGIARKYSQKHNLTVVEAWDKNVKSAAVAAGMPGAR